MDIRIPHVAGSPKVSVVVPLFNEADAIDQLRRRLEPVVDTLSKQGPVELVLVDDGSTDRTHECVLNAFELLANSTVRILRHDENRGLGAAIATGFDGATGDIVCIMDSDCTYDPEELPKLIDRLVESGADIATASPYHPEGKVVGCPAWRIALSKSASQLYRVVSPVRLYCYTSMFRAHRREWASSELFQATGFVAVPEYILAAAHAGARIVEYPAVLRSRQFGVSKMRTISVALSHLRLISTYLLRPTLKRVAFRPGSAGQADAPVRGDVNDFGKVMKTIDPADTPADAGTK